MSNHLHVHLGPYLKISGSSVEVPDHLCDIFSECEVESPKGVTIWIANQRIEGVPELVDIESGEAAAIALSVSLMMDAVSKFSDYVKQHRLDLRQFDACELCYGVVTYWG